MILCHSHCGLIFWLVILLLSVVHHYMWDCCWYRCCFLVCLMLKVLLKMYVWVKTHWLEVHCFLDYYYFFYLCSSKMSDVKWWLTNDWKRMKNHCGLWCSLCLSVALFCVGHLLSTLFSLYLSFHRPFSVVFVMLKKHHRGLLLSCKPIFHEDQECQLLGLLLAHFLLLLY